MNMRKKYGKILFSVALSLIAYIVGSISAFAYPSYAPDYADSKEINSLFMNEFFQEFMNLRWKEDTVNDVVELLVKNNLHYDTEIVFDDSLEIKIINKDKSPVFEISSSFGSIAVEELNLYFNPNDESGVLTWAHFSTQQSMTSLTKYFSHFYDVDISYYESEPSYIQIQGIELELEPMRSTFLKGNDFNISIDDHSNITDVYIDPDPNDRF